MKYLGKKEARGLWGIKHTRKPVDDLVGLARGLGAGAALPYLQLSVCQRGVLVSPHKTNTWTAQSDTAPQPAHPGCGIHIASYCYRTPKT